MSWVVVIPKEGRVCMAQWYDDFLDFFFLSQCHTKRGMGLSFFWYDNDSDDTGWSYSERRNSEQWDIILHTNVMMGTIFFCQTVVLQCCIIIHVYTIWFPIIGNCLKVCKRCIFVLINPERALKGLVSLVYYNDLMTFLLNIMVKTFYFQKNLPE